MDKLLAIAAIVISLICLLAFHEEDPRLVAFGSMPMTRHQYRIPTHRRHPKPNKQGFHEEAPRSVTCGEMARPTKRVAKYRRQRKHNKPMAVHEEYPGQPTDIWSSRLRKRKPNQQMHPVTNGARKSKDKRNNGRGQKMSYCGVRGATYTNPPRIPPATRECLHVYVLPVGQGDAHVIQCPSGDLTIVDLGTSTSMHDRLHWNSDAIDKFLEGQFNNIHNIIITHNDQDHLNLMPIVFNHTLNSHTNIYISCKEDDLKQEIKDWLNRTGLNDRVRTFSEGRPCIHPSCDEEGLFNICPSDHNITVKVMSANLGDCNKKKNNTDSIVFKVTVSRTSIMFNGDFDGNTGYTNEAWWTEYYDTTIFKLAHHGANNTANLPERQFIRTNPKAIFVSSNPSHYGHPICSVIDHFIGLDTLYEARNMLGQQLQPSYICGNDTLSLRDNQHAIYTTQRDTANINLIKISVHCSGHWELHNNFLNIESQNP